MDRIIDFDKANTVNYINEPICLIGKYFRHEIALIISIGVVLLNILFPFQLISNDVHHSIFAHHNLLKKSLQKMRNV